jgi:Fe2+/Zn2+ uptake regulation proteins
MRNRTQQEFDEILENARDRKTHQKQAIFEFLYTKKSPVYIYEIVRALPEINRSTIYRVLDRFVSLGVAKRVARGFKTLYEIGEEFNQHHHHVICEKCHKTVAVNDDAMEDLIHKITCSAGMRPTNHDVELYGICVDCERII